MQKLINFLKKNWYFIFLLLILIPSFWRMIKPGIYSTQDFHFFRLVEFDKCTQDFQLPCRWSSDAGYGYGEPLFNFYTQLPYAIGEIIHLTGIPLVNSLKILFIVSLLGSGIAMYFLAKKMWGNSWSALISAVIYVYAPYRAVDVWVRGALPEALSFVLFPLIILKIEEYFKKKKNADLIWFGILLTLLVLTHNLSIILFAPFLFSLIIYRVVDSKNYKLIWNIASSFLIPVFLSAFYFLPVIFESRFINLSSTIKGYFDFKGHFVTLYQLLISRFWGYGASVFGAEDGMSLSVGSLQWLIPTALVIWVLFKKKIRENRYLIFLVIIAWAYLFLTHNKSTIIWQLTKPMAYIQFPWRFLGVSLFVFSLAAGSIANIIRKKTVVVSGAIIFLVLALNFSFFKEDIWYKVTDKDLTSGKRWEDQTSASIGDYWPIFGSDLPKNFAPLDPQEGKLIERESNKVIYSINKKKVSETVLPMVYFPGWEAYSEAQKLQIYPSGRYGLISINNLPKGEQIIILKFSNTQVRAIGNLISLISFTVLFFIYAKVRKDEK